MGKQNKKIKQSEIYKQLNKSLRPLSDGESVLMKYKYHPPEAAALVPAVANKSKRERSRHDKKRYK